MNWNIYRTKGIPMARRMRTQRFQSLPNCCVRQKRSSIDHVREVGAIVYSRPVWEQLKAGGYLERER